MTLRTGRAETKGATLMFIFGCKVNKPDMAQALGVSQRAGVLLVSVTRVHPQLICQPSISNSRLKTNEENLHQHLQPQSKMQVQNESLSCCELGAKRALAACKVLHT